MPVVFVAECRREKQYVAKICVCGLKTLILDQISKVALDSRVAQYDNRSMQGEFEDRNKVQAEMDQREKDIDRWLSVNSSQGDILRQRALILKSAPDAIDDWRKWVKNRLEELGITQAELAAAIPLTPGNLSRWLNGGVISAARISRAMELLGYGVEAEVENWNMKELLSYIASRHQS